MGSKAALVNGEERQTKQSPVKRQEPNAMGNLFDKMKDKWDGMIRFFSDVRAEMRKVVAPNRKEVENTTVVVIFAVFIFGLFFFVVDSIFGNIMNRLLARLSGM